MSKSDALENALLDHVLGGGDYTRPANVYLALYTVAPTDSGGGTEVSGGDYARAAVVNNATNWPAASGGVKQNGTAITFPEATAAWGTIVAVGLFDAASGGSLLYWSNLTTPKVVDAGDTARFPIGSIQITED